MRHLPSRSLVAVAALAGALLAGELLARFGLGLGNPPLFIADPLTEYRLRPDQQLNRFGHHLEVNAFSMRSAPLPLQRDDHRRRLLVFGDSIVWGGAVLDQRLIATSLLRGPQWPEVGNVAAPSWGPGNWLGYAHRFGFLQATDLVLVIGSDDAADNPGPRPFRGDANHPLAPPPSALVEGIQRYLLPRLGLAPRETGAPQTTAPPPAPLTGADDPRVQRGLSDLRSFLRLARASGAHVAAVQFADRQETASGQLQPGNRWIAAVLRQEGIPSLQAGPIFRACGPVASLYSDHIHPYTAAGQACLAKAIARALALPAPAR